MSVPILAIKEANEHLQALFLENQKKEGQIHVLSASLKEAQEENATLNEHLKAVNERVLKLQEEHSDGLNKLCTENQQQIVELNKSHKKILAEVEERLVENQQQILELKKSQEKALTEVEERLKLEEYLKREEEAKVTQLTKAIGEERLKVAELERKIQKVNDHIAKRSKCREENVVLLNNIFKSTMENMSVCLSITGKDDFVGAEPLAMQEADGATLHNGDSAYSSKVHLLEDDIQLNDSDTNGLNSSSKMQVEGKGSVADCDITSSMSCKVQQDKNGFGSNENDSADFANSAEFDVIQHETDSLDGYDSPYPSEYPQSEFPSNDELAVTNFQVKVNGVLDSSIT